jgi:aspartyl protease
MTMARKWFLMAVGTAILAPLPTASAPAASAPLGGFIPYVGIGLTNEFKDSTTDLTGTFFLAEPEPFLVGSPLSGNGAPYYDLALLDTGAATHIFTLEASGSSGFDIDGNGFDGTNFQQVGGATGLINLEINDPLGVFVAGLGNRVSADSTLVMETSALRGQSSVATLSAPAEWELPNIIGLPMAAQHAIHIKNSEPQIFQHQGRTVRTPQVSLVDLGTGNLQGIARRTDLKIRPGASFVSGPLYIQNLDIFGGSFNFHDNPLSPTVVESGGLFVDVDMTDGSNALEDTELLFDTGADLTVVSQMTAVRLGFDAVLDTPDFVLSVEGSGGVSSGVPGFYVDQLKIDTVGGPFILENVPIAVLDVANPNDPGNIIDGIVGMHLFTGRDLVIDAKPAIGQGGAGPSLYISDPVTETHQWAGTQATGTWSTASNWNGAGTPSLMWVATVAPAAASDQIVTVDSDSTIFELAVAGNGPAAMTVKIASGTTLTTFGESRIEQGGGILLENGRLDAPFINIEGGTLAGTGETFVGTGPVSGVVRNLSGHIEPGDPIGKLTIIGDLSNQQEGTLAFDLAGISAETEYDQLAIERFAFLGGRLEVSLLDGFVPEVGNLFTLITAGEEVVGQFDQFTLPGGFQWDIQYLAQSVLLEVTGMAALAGDFDHDSDVDADDLAAWRTGFAAGTYSGTDFLAWQRNVGATTGGSIAASVPEPCALALGLIGMGLLAYRRIR